MASVTVNPMSHFVGPSGAGCEQGDGLRDQAQGYELWTDERDGKAAAGRSSKAAEPSRNGG